MRQLRWWLHQGKNFRDGFKHGRDCPKDNIWPEGDELPTAEQLDALEELEAARVRVSSAASSSHG